MANKITKAQMFSAIANFALGESLPESIKTSDVVDFCNRELELLAQKQEKAQANAVKRKAENNAPIQNLILEALSGRTEPAQVSELMHDSPDLEALSVQKVSALMRGLVAEGKVIRTEEKRKAYFSIA